MNKYVPRYEVISINNVNNNSCVIIPVINEGKRIINQLREIQKINDSFDVIICDGGSTDNSLDINLLKKLNITSLLLKKDKGKLSAQLLTAFDWAIKNNYLYFVTIDGNNKDSVEDIPSFFLKLKNGFDFVQGSRFIRGGKAINTPFSRLLALKILHAPITSLTANFRFTDTTNGFRGYSLKYLTHPKVDLFREVFNTYELLAYLSVRASQLKLNVIEIPVTRAYPKKGQIPTKISFFKGNFLLMKILILNFFRKYNPK